MVRKINTIVFFNELVGSNVSPSKKQKTCNTHTATVFLKAEKREERTVAKNKTVTTVIQCVCFTCLDRGVPLIINVLELFLISNIKRLRATMLAKKKERNRGKRN